VIVDRGAYVEVHIGPPRLRAASAVDELAAAAAASGTKPMLVICDDPHGEVSLEDAYRLGRALAERVASPRIAIALRGRRASETDRFIELVAATRGGALRYFDDPPAALSWLGA
jgi:hypothetical protein